MPLDYEKLIKFDLLEQLEENTPGNIIDRYVQMFGIMSEINSTDQFIRECPSYPGSTDKIIRSEMNLAIGSTLSIEGINLSQEEIEESFQKADKNQALQRKEQEAENSRKVYRFIIETVELFKEKKDKLQISEEMIKQMHKYFTENMDYLGNTPGDYHGDFPSTFGEPRKESLCKTRLDVERAMSKFIIWLNEDHKGLFSRDPLIKAIMAHYYLSEIHPFGDGNGRTARALEALILYSSENNEYSFWSLANFWSANRNEYLHLLGQIRATCDPLDFIEWGLKGYLGEVSRIKENVLKKLKQIMLMDYTRFLLNNKRNEKIKINKRIVEVIGLLTKLGIPIELDKLSSSPQIKTLYKTPSTWYRDLKKMRLLELVTTSQDENGKEYIEPNYSTLETITYNVR